MNYYIQLSSSILHFRKNILILFFLCLLSSFHPPIYAGSAGIPQEARINQRKIDKERAKKDKEGMKQYQRAVKKHMDNQSKDAKIMMKKARKDAKKNTPLK